MAVGGIVTCSVRPSFDHWRLDGGTASPSIVGVTDWVFIGLEKVRASFDLGATSEFSPRGLPPAVIDVTATLGWVSKLARKPLSVDAWVASGTSPMLSVYRVAVSQR